MSTISHRRESFAGERQDEISEFCQGLFAPFARSDQRRWGEVYLRGLLHADGRKTPANISEHVLGRRAVQPIQQFVNQSTWSFESVRRHLAERVCAVTPPEAWAFDEVVFPKNGDRSAGVGRQFVASEGRMMNCQLALAASLVHKAGSLPVNWHLMLPRHWDRDHELRGQAHIPEEERHRPRWSYVLESVDEILHEWNVPIAPILADWSFEHEVEPLLLGLEERGLGYLVEIAASAQLPVRRLGGPAGSYRRPAADLARDLGEHGERAVLAWQDRPENRSRHSQFMVGRLPAGHHPKLHGAGPRGARHLVVEWPFGRPQPRTYWVTNLPASRLAETVALAELRHKASHGCEKLQAFGLGDFEGRSFRGWHHHVTLASAALGYHALRELCQDGEREQEEEQVGRPGVRVRVN
ncbi:IS701 family transposase [Kitasatospora sp. NBC_01250]|uniref:IS701 family transposase n=1 Tax=unclassified Kitasatospora TaxID=2633591 RepID=UPI002E155F81|nr:MULTISPECIES: IS701 family transposase [unclassified Kitasatospora]WSJ67856.1 IS701 family transposase [Kitasatospora sp. NBC_01302]